MKTMIFKNKIGLGTSLFGSTPANINYHSMLLDTALEIGYRLFDTGESYANGECEKIIGNAIGKSLLSRDNFEIVTKFIPHNNPIISCQRSIDRLHCEYVDAYLLHFLLPHQRNISNIKFFIESLVSLRDKKLINHIGFSNLEIADVIMWKQAENELGLSDDNKAKVWQYQYSLQRRKADIAIHKLINDNRMTAMPHSPFGGGRISGSSRPPQPGSPGDFWTYPNTLALKPIAESIGAMVPQLILAFVNRQSNSVVFPKSFKKENLLINFNSTQYISKITKEVYDKIEELFPIDNT